MIAAANPMLAATLLEIVHERALHASTDRLLSDPVETPITSPLPEQEEDMSFQLSEQTTLISTLTDALPSLSLELLIEWLPLTASLVNRIPDLPVRDRSRSHFWDVIVGGDMDPERSQVCVTWWTSEGGRELLLYGGMESSEADQQYLMSGGLNEEKMAAKL